VSCFRDEAEVYRYIGRLLQSIVEDDELAPRFQRANTILQYQYSDPDAQITVKLLDGEDPRVDLGPTELEPEVVMTMDAEIAHRFWLGEVNVTVALARGQMRASGPVAKILRLVPHAKRVFPRYRTMLEEAGREDLLRPMELAGR
jgi:putative sterol carrier protein